MPKTRRRNTRNTRRKGSSVKSNARPLPTPDTHKGHHYISEDVLPSRRARGTAAAPAFTVTLFPAMCALGCWGMVVFFIFLTNGANHLAFGGITALMALFWSYMFSVRLRKMLRQRA